MPVIHEVGEIGLSKNMNCILWSIKSLAELPQTVGTTIWSPLFFRYKEIRNFIDVRLSVRKLSLSELKNLPDFGDITIGIACEKGNVIYLSAASWSGNFNDFIAKNPLSPPHVIFRLFCEIRCSAVDTFSKTKLESATKSEASASNTEKSTDQFVLNVSSKPEEDNDVQIVAEITPEDKEAHNQDFKCLQKLSENLKDLYVGSQDCDLTLKVKDKEFKAHKFILRARTPVFNAMLSHDLAESKEGIITIEDCDPEVFEDFLLFIYAGRVENLSSDNVCGLYYTADKYDLPELKDKCIHYLKKSMSPETICDVISLATKHSESELLNLAVQFFVENVEKILETVNWQLYLKENPIEANELYIKALNIGFTKKR